MKKQLLILLLACGFNAFSMEYTGSQQSKYQKTESDSDSDNEGENIPELKTMIDSLQKLCINAIYKHSNNPSYSQDLSNGAMNLIITSIDKQLVNQLIQDLPESIAHKYEGNILEMIESNEYTIDQKIFLIRKFINHPTESSVKQYLLSLIFNETTDSHIRFLILNSLVQSEEFYSINEAKLMELMKEKTGIPLIRAQIYLGIKKLQNDDTLIKSIFSQVMHLYQQESKANPESIFWNKLIPGYIISLIEKIPCLQTQAKEILLLVINLLPEEYANEIFNFFISIQSHKTARIHPFEINQLLECDQEDNQQHQTCERGVVYVTPYKIELFSKHEINLPLCFIKFFNEYIRPELINYSSFVLDPSKKYAAVALKNNINTLILMVSLGKMGAEAKVLCTLSVPVDIESISWSTDGLYLIIENAQELSKIAIPHSLIYKEFTTQELFNMVNAIPEAATPEMILDTVKGDLVNLL